MSIRVLLIEDHFLARMALRSVLNGRGDISLVAEASDGASGVEMYRMRLPPSANCARQPRSQFLVITRAARIFIAPSAMAPWPT